MPVLPVERHTPMPNTRFYIDPRQPDHQRESQPLAAIPDAAPAARRFVAALLRKWGLDQVTGCIGLRGEDRVELVEAVELVADELVANSVNETGRSTPTSYTDLRAHPPPLIELQLRVTGTRLLCEVWDPSPDQPVPSIPRLEDESGRGLLLVSAYATDWTSYPSPSGHGKVTVAWWNLPVLGHDMGA